MTLQQRENELNEKWYPTKIAAQILGMDRSYLSMLIKRGDIKALKVPGKGRYGIVYKISESELEKFEVFRAMKKEGKNVEIEGDHIVEKGDISEEPVEEVPMTKDEIKERLPEEVRPRFEKKRLYSGSVKVKMPDIHELYNEIYMKVRSDYDEEMQKAYQRGYEAGYRAGTWTKKQRYLKGENRYDSQD